jgi:hypothetical protein
VKDTAAASKQDFYLEMPGIGITAHFCFKLPWQPRRLRITGQPGRATARRWGHLPPCFKTPTLLACLPALLSPCFSGRATVGLAAWRAKEPTPESISKVTDSEMILLSSQLAAPPRALRLRGERRIAYASCSVARGEEPTLDAPWREEKSLR